MFSVSGRFLWWASAFYLSQIITSNWHLWWIKWLFNKGGVCTIFWNEYWRLYWPKIKFLILLIPTFKSSIFCLQCGDLLAKMATINLLPFYTGMQLSFQVEFIPSYTLLRMGWPRTALTIKFSGNAIVPVWGLDFNNASSFCFLPLGTRPLCCEEAQAITWKSP